MATEPRWDRYAAVADEDLLLGEAGRWYSCNECLADGVTLTAALIADIQLAEHDAWHAAEFEPTEPDV